MIIDPLRLDINTTLFLILDTYFLIPRVPLPRPPAFRCSLMIYITPFSDYLYILGPPTCLTVLITSFCEFP